MKIRTVGLLSTLAVMLTSATVWSVTPPGGFFDSLREQAQARGVQGPDLAADAWRFSTGSTVEVEGRLGHPELSADRPNETYVYVRAHAPAGQVATDSAPLDLAIAIDRSGSMKGERLRNAKDAARTMVRRLREGDVVSVIAYDTETEMLVAPTTIDGSSRQRIIEAIESVRLGGDTCISCAVEAGMQAVQGRSGMIKRVLVLSDGKATDGVRDIPGFERLAGRAREMGCSITSVGVDVEYNERIMSALARGSNGRHYFVENAASLPKIFDEEVRSLVRTVATDGELRVSLAPGVQVLEVVDRVSRREGDAVVVPLGAFTAGEEKTLLMRVRVPRGAEGLRRVADVDLRFGDLVAGDRGDCQGQLHASLSEEVTTLPPLDPVVGARLGRARTAASLRKANRLFEEGDASAARDRLSDARQSIANRKKALAKRAKPKARPRVNDDFDRQIGALEQAEEGFATPPPAPGQAQAAPAKPSRENAAQKRRNTEAADAFSF